jgi:hypothetical protein
METNHILIENQKGNQISYNFCSPLYFTDNLYIKPFGSSRMRYENKKVLDLKLKLQRRENNMNYYNITISKILDQLKKSRNATFFYNNNFEVELEIWCPLYYKNLNIKLIRSLLPVDYGEIHFNNIKYSNKQYKFGIVVPFYSRYDYVDQFLNSFKNTNLSDCLIVFMDESLTKDVNEDHKKVNKLIQDFQLEFPLIKIFKNKHGNMFDSILYGMDLLYSYCDFLCTIDSDTIFKRDWIHTIYHSYNECKKDFPNYNLLVSGFNIENAHHSVIEKKQNYILKNSVGGCNMFFSKEIYTTIIRRCLFSHKWDTNIVNSIKEFDCKIITTNPSVIQHIGFDTSIEYRKGNKTYDYAEDF